MLTADQVWAWDGLNRPFLDGIKIVLILNNGPHGLDSFKTVQMVLKWQFYISTYACAGRQQ